MKRVVKFFLTVILTFSLFLPVFAENEVFESFDEITEPGKYRVRIYYEDAQGEQHSTVVNVTITDDDLNKDYPSKTTSVVEVPIYEEDVLRRTEMITASSFNITRGSLSRISNARLIELADARAWIKETGESLPIAKVERSFSDSQIEVLFETANKTKIRVYAYELNPNVAKWTLTKNTDDGIPFQSITFSGIMLTIIILLIIPAIVISCIFFYVQKQIMHVDEILYDDKNDETKKNQNT